MAQNQQRKLHICMVGVKGVPVPSGPERVVEQIGSRLVRRGHRVTVYVRKHYTPRECKEWKGMRLVHAPSIPTRSLDAITATFFATWLAIFERPDVIHIHSQGQSIYAWLPRLFGIKTIVQSHGLDWQRAKWQGFAKWFLKATDWSTVFFPNATTAVSRKLQRYYQEKFHRPIAYIPNGAAEPAHRPPEEIRKLGLAGRDYVLFAARLVPEKFCHGLVEAYRRIPNPSKKLVIAGDSNYGDDYAARLKEQAGENILFLGFVQGRMMEELFSNAYLYVLPSEIEGLSTGLIEAMSYGNCVLVSDIEENLEVIGENGVAFKKGDVNDLHSKLDGLLQAEETVAEYRRRAAAYALEKFNWERVTTAFEELYRSL